MLSQDKNFAITDPDALTTILKYRCRAELNNANLNHSQQWFIQ